MKKDNKITTGLVLILIAAVLMGSELGLIPKLPWFKLIVACGFGIWSVKSLLKLDFFGTLFPASLIVWLFEKELMIEEITPFPLVVAAILVGCGLNMIFGRKQKVVSVRYKDEDGNWKDGNIKDAKVEKWQDGREVVLENLFNATSKYVNSASFSSAKLENNFGSANVYFDNATVYNGEATIKLENNFGKMNIYLPGTWRASIHQEAAFGHVNVHGEPNRDMDAPYVIIKAESNFGEIDIFFD